MCIKCLIELPKTNFHADIDNPVIKSFWGRAPVTSAAACYYFKKGTNIQHLLHNLKYKGQTQVGLTVGRLYGNELKQSPNFNTVDVVIPVPLHKSKRRKRGYNQSEFFARGLAQGMDIVVDSENLVKTVATDSQTRKNRMERVENVNNVFTLLNPESLKNKHILLVDDVITTGATIEACALKLAEVPGIKISVAAIAYAQ